MLLHSSHAEALAAGAKYYFTGRRCKRGHLSKRYTSSESCVECSKKRHLEKSEDDKEKQNAAQRERYATDSDYRARVKASRDATRSTAEFWERENKRQRNKRENDEEFRLKMNAYNREYSSTPERKKRRKEVDAARYLKMKDEGKTKSIERREYSRKYMRKRMAENPNVRLSMAVSAGIRRSLKTSKGGKKWEHLVGYTIGDITSHLERLFQPGMTWDNYGDWHVDHKIPLAAHNFETPEDIDFKKAWALDNLQPLWATDNIKKRDTLLAPFQPSLALAIPANDNVPASVQSESA